MAERRRTPKDFAEDKIVRDLVPDPGQPPPDSVVLRGFMGKSDRDGHRRLYLDDSLSSWVEIPEEEILHVETTPDDESGTAIWVKRSAQLETKSVQSASAPAEFLSGDIAGAAAGGLRPGAPGLKGVPLSPFCPPWTVEEIRCPGFETFEFACSIGCPPNTVDFPCAQLSVNFPCQRTPDLPCRRTPDLPCVQTLQVPCPKSVDFICPQTPVAPCGGRTPALPCVNDTFVCPPPTSRCPQKTPRCPNVTPGCGGRPF